MGNAFAGVSIYGGATANDVGGPGAAYPQYISGNGRDGVESGHWDDRQRRRW